MDGFGWSMQYAAEPCLPRCPSDDDGLLSAVMGTSFHDGAVHSDHGSLGNMSPSQMTANLVQHCHDAMGLPENIPAPAFMGMGTASDMLPSVTSAVNDGLLLDTFAYAPNVTEGPTAQATVSNSNTAFSGYGSTTGGGNISSGESNTFGGSGGHQDIEVASPCAAVVRPITLAPSKRKVAAELRGAKRAATSSSLSSTSITFGQQSDHHRQASRATTLLGNGSGYEPDAEALAQVKEMIYRAAAMRPVHQLIGMASSTEPSHHHHQNNNSNNRPRRKNVRISSDPQTVAARLRRERVSERLRVLQRLVPGGTRMDTASMLDEAASYLKFLKSQLQALENAGNPSSSNGGGHCGNGTSSLQQSYYYVGNDNLGGGGGGGGGTGSGARGTVLAFGSRDGIGGYVKSNRTMPL